MKNYAKTLSQLVLSHIIMINSLWAQPMKHVREDVGSKFGHQRPTLSKIIEFCVFFEQNRPLWPFKTYLTNKFLPFRNFCVLPISKSQNSISSAIFQEFKKLKIF